MFLGVGIENIALATLDVPSRWAWALFGGVWALMQGITSIVRGLEIRALREEL